MKTLSLATGGEMLAVEELYRQEIRSLPAADRLQLLALIAQELVVVQVRTTRRITELRIG